MSLVGLTREAVIHRSGIEVPIWPRLTPLVSLTSTGLDFGGSGPATTCGRIGPSSSGSRFYRPRDAKHTVLHQIVAEPPEEVGDATGLPQFVEREFLEDVERLTLFHLAKPTAIFRRNHTAIRVRSLCSASAPDALIDGLLTLLMTR